MTSTSHKSTMKIGDRRRENVAIGDLRVDRLAKVVIEAKAEMVTARIVVLDAEIPTEADRHRVVSLAIVVPKGAAEMQVTTVVQMDADPRGGSRATEDQMVEVPKHAVLATVGLKAEVRMGRVLVIVDRKDADPMHVVPMTVVRTGVVPNVVVQAARVANILDGQVTDHTVIVGSMVIVVTVEITGDQADRTLAIAGPIIEAASPLIEAQADQTLVIETAAIADLEITSSDAAKDVDRVEANLLIVVLKTEDLLVVTGIITDSTIDGLNTMARAVQAAATSGIMADRVNTISGMTVIVVPKAADLPTMRATTGDSVAEVDSDIMEDRNISVAAQLSDIMAARADMSLLIVKVAALVDHNSLIAMAEAIVVAARNAMLGFLIRDKVLMQNLVSPDGIDPIIRDRVLIGLPWMADRQAVVQVDQTSAVVAVPGAPDLAVRAQVVRVSADILRLPKCWTLLTPTRTAS